MNHTQTPGGLKRILRYLFYDDVPVKYRESYSEFCREKNAKRLPLLFLFMVLHRISSMIAYLYLYPVLFSVYSSPVETVFIIYSVFYFIFLLLASYITKKFSDRIAENPKLLELLSFAAFVVLILDDLITIIFSLSLPNPIRFVGGTLLIALALVFTKKMAGTLIGMYLVTTVSFKLILSPSIEMHVIGSLYFVFLAFAAIFASSNYKNRLLLYYLEEQKIAEQNLVLKKLSVTDALTKISNRRAFDEYLNKAWEAAKIKKQALTVMMMDVDHFKLYNDNFGHVEGDKCLVHIAEAISGKFRRRGDMFARFGGEEFVAVMANEPGDDIIKFAEKIRKAVEELEIPNPLSSLTPYVTISIGVANRTPGENCTPSIIIEMADAALYAAKQTGRNRVVADFEGGSSFTVEKQKPGTSYINFDDEYSDELRKDFLCTNAIAKADMLCTFFFDTKTSIMKFGADAAKKLNLSDAHLQEVSITYEDFIQHAHQDDKQNLKHTFEAIINGEYTFTDLTYFRMPINNGDYGWVQMKIMYVSNLTNFGSLLAEQNNLSDSAVLGSISDFSAFMRMQEINLLTVEGASLYSYNYNFKTDIVYFNDNFYKDFGLPNKSIEKGIDWLMGFLRSQSSKEDFTKAMAQLRSAETDRIDFKLNVFNTYLKNAQWLLFKGKCSRDSQGKPEVLAGTISDITQEKRSEELNSLIIEGSSDCIFVFDLERNIFEFSSKIHDLVSVKTRRMTNGLETWLNYIIAVDQEVFTGALADVYEGKTDTFRVEYRLKGKNSMPFWVACSGKCMLDEHSKPILIAGSLVNLDKMRQFSAYLDEIRNVDKLSGLPNRIAFNQELDNNFDGLETAPIKHENGYLMVVDIDDFGNINSMHGLSVGDRLLTEYGALLTLVVPHDTKLYHFESNRFVIYRSHSNTGRKDIEGICEQIRMYSSNGLLVDDVHVKMTVSIGVAEFTAKDTLDDALVSAELALRKAKLQKNRVDFFMPEDMASYLARLNLEAELRECVLDDFRGFEVFYQPFYSVSLSMIVGGEALLRWRSREGKIVPPDLIIPALQSIGMFAEVESWIFKSATAKCGEWVKLTGFKNLIININMSPKRVARGSLIDEVMEAVNKAGISLGNIFLELTEDSLVMESQANMNMLRELQQRGIHIAIDDFGTGYSSLGYLRDLPVCELKIDRSFITDIETNLSNREFVGAIIALCHIMNYMVCVEGVETLGQARILKELNADILQGYYFSRPLPPDEFEKMFLHDMTSSEKFVQRFNEISESCLTEQELAMLEG